MLYDYQCTKCQNIQAFQRSIKECEELGHINKDYECEICKVKNVMQRIVSTDIQVIDKSRIRLNGDPHMEAEYKKRAKDPDRARKARRDKFGSDGISITKSPYYKKDKRIKAKGNQDVDKKQFIQAAARNPHALKAAQDAIKRAGKKS
jgi:hypothetical protein